LPESSPPVKTAHAIRSAQAGEALGTPVGPSLTLPSLKRAPIQSILLYKMTKIE
jgi:hypothetical protein